MLDFLIRKVLANGPIVLYNPVNRTLGEILDGAINWMAGLGIPIAAVIIVYAGFKIMFSGGDPNAFKEGRKIILYALVGIGLILLSKTVITIVETLLQGE